MAFVRLPGCRPDSLRAKLFAPAVSDLSPPVGLVGTSPTTSVHSGLSELRPTLLLLFAGAAVRVGGKRHSRRAHRSRRGPGKGRFSLCGATSAWLSTGRVCCSGNARLQGATTGIRVQPDSNGDDDDIAALTSNTTSDALAELAGVDRSFWPLLMEAAEAEAQLTGVAQDLGGNLARAARGLTEWRQALAAGHLWEEDDGANWPVDRNLRRQWGEMLRELEMPRFTRKYPKLLDPLLASLLETVQKLPGEMGSDGSQVSNPEGEGQDEEEDNSNEQQTDTDGDAAGAADGGEEQARDSSESTGQATGADDDAAAAAEEEPQGQIDNAAEDGAAGETVGDDTNAAEDTDPQSQAAATKLMDDLKQEWKGAVSSLKEADDALGSDAGDLVADGISSGSDALWHETAGWKEIPALRAILKQNPSLRELIRELGRRSAARGPLRRLPEEVPKVHGAMGVTRSEVAQTESSGVRLSGDLSRMLPSEAQLLAAKQPALRTLHHARRIERSLLSYDRTAWLEEEALRTKKKELRPMGHAGPLIICLDTSGSMQGPRETLGKALVLESMRQAHRQKRKCYLYAFSGLGQLEELELSLSTSGLRGLLDFLKFSFSGGTSLDAALEASVRRLTTEDDWRNADLLIVTDGEVPMPEDDIVADLMKAQDLEGARVVGIVLSTDHGEVMQQVCDEIYVTGDPHERPSWAYGAQRHSLLDGGNDLTSWKPWASSKDKQWPRLRKVQERRPINVATRSTAEAASRVHTGSTEMFAATPRGRPGVGPAFGASFRRAFLNVGFARAVEQHSAATALCAARSSSSAADASGDAKTRVPNFGRFSDALTLVIQEAEQEARRLRQPTLGTESLLLGILSAPAAATLRSATFGTASSSIDQARAAVEELINVGQRGSGSAGGRKARGVPPLRFTPMVNRALLDAEEEMEHLGQQNVEPAHLLLALMRDPRGAAREILVSMEANLDMVRQQILGTLPGPTASVKLQAMMGIKKLRDSIVAEGTVDPGSVGGPFAQQLADAHKLLSQGLVERSVESKLLLLAALSGEHVFFLGPPGTAKSLLARRLALVCRGRFFEQLLTRFSVPEEVFGPLSLKALENDELRRRTEGFLPEAEVAFLDEVFKANSSILNSLLTILNERCYDNGGARLKVPLWCAVAASNELPESDELDALFDRFLLRRAVPRVSDDAVPGFLRAALDAEATEAEMEGQEEEEGGMPPPPPPRPLLTAADSAAARRAAAERVEFPERLLRLVTALRRYLRDEADPPVAVSDRRLAKAVRLVRVAAYAVGAEKVSPLDLLLLQHVFWDKEPELTAQIKDWLLDRCATRRAGTADNEDLGDNDGEDYVPQARHIFGIIRGRLRRSVPLKSSSVSSALRDLRGVRGALEDQLKRLLEEEASLRSAFQDKIRTFWLEPSDVAEANERLLPRLESASREAEQLLIEVLELAGALELKDTEQRDSCVKALLDASQDSDQDAAGQDQLDLKSLNSWAASLRDKKLPDITNLSL